MPSGTNDRTEFDFFKFCCRCKTNLDALQSERDIVNWQIRALNAAEQQMDAINEATNKSIEEITRIADENAINRERIDASRSALTERQKRIDYELPRLKVGLFIGMHIIAY
jgi:chromosome segregation ATPase